MRGRRSTGWSRLADRSPADATTTRLSDLAADAARLARVVLTEDGGRDITTELAGLADAAGAGVIEFRGGGVVAGLAYAEAVAHACGGLRVEWSVGDADRVKAGATIGRVMGPLGALLRAERPLLNLLQRACGIATLTRAYVDAVAGTRCAILHTRKTAPGLRAFDVRAVLAGGGAMHRTDLAAIPLIKDNHWRALAGLGGRVADAIAAARSAGLPCYVEVDSLQQVERAARAGATRLLVDNQSPATFAQFAEVARAIAPVIELEASGGITLESVRAYAEAGADLVSVGALTHSVKAADVALEMAT